MSQSVENVLNAVAYIQEKAAARHPVSSHPGRTPFYGLILGSGLGPVAERIESPVILDYEDIPGFPRPSVLGHQGRLLAGTLGRTPVVCLCGRVHLYEGRSPAEACFGVRVLAELGAASLVLTNAVGGLDPTLRVGELMLVTDHINMTGQSPLTGPNVEAWGPRFPDMGRVYDPGLGRALDAAAQGLGLALRRGVLVQVAGPQLETPAETRAFRLLGGDAVGMSTALEAVAAAHRGLPVAAVSCVTNVNLPEDMAPISHEAVLAEADKAAGRLADLLETAGPGLVQTG